MRRFAAVALLLAVAAAMLPAAAAACPLCKESGDAAQASLWEGMAWSIYLMMAAPFTLFGVMALLIVRARKRHLAATSPPAASPENRGGERP